MIREHAQLLCPVLVGRDAEVAALREALDRAVQGHVSAVFIGGEAGIGKSRLCRALTKEARTRGLNPMMGLCGPQQADLPYGPIIDALRRALTRISPAAPALQTALAPVGPMLAPLLPEHGVAVPESVAGPTAVLRQRMFDALAHALRTLAAYHPDETRDAAPLVLVIDDAQWADESSLDFLQYALRTVRDVEDDEAGAGPGVLVVCTFRDEALATAPALHRALSALLGARLATHLSLHPLTFVQFTEFLDATLGRPVAPDIVTAAYERSEGNPFIAEELLSALAAGGHVDGNLGPELTTLHLPLSLHGAVMERLNLLPASARVLLSAAAVAGRTFDVDLLARVSSLDETTLLGGLRAALHAGLIEENPVGGGSATTTTGDRYRFRHALTRDVIYGELLAPERRAFHASIARALEGGLVDDTSGGGAAVEAVAYHYRLAGDGAKAAHFAVRAAAHARTLLAFAEARRHYAEALSYLSEDDPARLPLLEALGLLSLALLDVHGAVPYLDAATTLLRRLGLARKAAAVLGEVHHLLWFVDLARFRAMVGELDAAAEAARSGADGGGAEDGDALKTYCAAALAHAGYAHYDRALVWAQRALDLAARLDDGATAPVIYKALLARGHAFIHGAAGDGQAAECGLQDFHKALDLGLRHALPEAVQLAYNFLPRALLDLGRDAAAAEVIDQADAYARRSGVAAIADTRGYSLLHGGRWEEGIAVLREAIAASRAYGALSKGAMESVALGHVLVAQGDGRGAAEALEEARAVLEPSGQLVALMPCLRALACARALLGDADEAAALFAQARALWCSTQDRLAVVPLLLEGCLFYAGRGEVQQAGVWVRDLDRAGATPVAAAAVSHARGAVAAAMGQQALAQEHLRDAVARWEALGRPYNAARARAALGMAVLAAAHGKAGQRAAADALLVAAGEELMRLGARHDAAQVEAVRRRSGLLAQARRRRSLAAKRAPYGDLTPREVEVLALLAQGHTNRDIARALFISEGTAELHVSHILGKLGCSTRAQATAYAVAHSVVPPSAPAGEQGQ